MITLFAPARGRDGIIGDLLEEYHDEIVPARGVTAGDRWFGRQALAFFWRAVRPVGLGIAATLTARTLIDVIAPLPMNQLAVRASVTTYAAMAIFVVAGFRLGRATGRVPGAVFMALAGTAVATLLVWAGVVLAITVLTTYSMSPGVEAWNEALDIPFHVIAAVGVLLAGGGAAIGSRFTGSSGSRAGARS